MQFLPPHIEGRRQAIQDEKAVSEVIFQVSKAHLCAASVCDALSIGVNVVPGNVRWLVHDPIVERLLVVIPEPTKDPFDLTDAEILTCISRAAARELFDMWVPHA